jgi:hypothetical protein
VARRLGFWPVMLAAGLLAACGGGSGVPGGSTLAPVSSTGTGSGSGNGGGTGGAGGGTTADVCSLLTIDEARGAEQIPSQRSLTTAPEPNGCSWVLDDSSPALHVGVTHAAGNAQNLEGWAEDEPIDGVGDKAYFDGPGSILVFLVGDALVMIHSGWVQQTDATRTATTGMGRIIAARLRGQGVPAELEITPPPVVNARTACDLLTAGAAAALVKQGSMTRSGSADVPQFCSYVIDSTGATAISTSFKAVGGIAGWDPATMPSDAAPVSGVGDKALWAPFDQNLYVLKNDSIITVGVTGLGIEPGNADALAIAKALALAALANL